MSNEEKLPESKTISPADSQDSIDESLLKMFLMRDMAMVDESDPGELSVALSDRERHELERLQARSREKGIEDYLGETASAESIPPSTLGEAELPTQTESVETIAESDDESTSTQGKEQLLKMAHDVSRFEKTSCVSFHPTLRKTVELGRGGQGIVYRAEGEDEFSAVFALKVFLPQFCENPAEFITDMNRMQRIAALIHHEPHDDLVDLFWFGKTDGVYTMLMQFIDGFDLRRLLQPSLYKLLHQSLGKQRWEDINNVVYTANGSPQLALKPAIAVYIIERVLRGLISLHDRNIVHGDVKPSNIMLSASGCVKIVDPGSAFETFDPPRRHHFTPPYAAPEFLDGRPMTKQSDLASVGYMLIELLSGIPITNLVANPDESTRTISREMRMDLLETKHALPFRLQDILPPDVYKSELLVELCQRLIDPDPEKRFATATDAILHSAGTFEFNRDLMLMNLVVNNFHEVRLWLSNVKHATQAKQGV